MIYIQLRGPRYLETIDAFETLSEARAMLKEYQLSDRESHYYISRRACKDWLKQHLNKREATNDPQ